MTTITNNRPHRRNGRQSVDVPACLISVARQIKTWAFYGEAGAYAYQEPDGTVVSVLRFAWRGGAGVPEQPFREALEGLRPAWRVQSFHQYVYPSEGGTVAELSVRARPA